MTHVSTRVRPHFPRLNPELPPAPLYNCWFMATAANLTGNEGSVVQKDTVDQIADIVMQWPLDTRFYVLYALPNNQTQDQLATLLTDLKRRGFSRLYQNGQTFDYSRPESLLDVDFGKTTYVLV